MNPILIISQELITTFTSRFINHPRAYYQQWSNGTEYGYKAVYSPPTTEIMASHLKGDITISAPALDENNHGKWLMFDSDKEDSSLHKLDAFLQDHHWHTLQEGRRPGRDGHLWILLDSPIAGEHLINLASAMVSLAGVNNSGIEIFPKQAKAEKLASGVRLPLGTHLKPGANNCRGWFDTPAQNMQAQLTWLAAQPLNDADTAIELAEKHKPIILPPIQLVSKYRSSSYEKINILDFVQARRFGKELAAQCPLCAAEGHDKHRDNLRISIDGGKFCCWYGGAAKVHKAADIVRALKGRA